MAYEGFVVWWFLFLLYSIAITNYNSTVLSALQAKNKETVLTLRLAGSAWAIWTIRSVTSLFHFPFPSPLRDVDKESAGGHTNCSGSLFSAALHYSITPEYSVAWNQNAGFSYWVRNVKPATWKKKQHFNLLSCPSTILLHLWPSQAHNVSHEWTWTTFSYETGEGFRHLVVRPPTVPKIVVMLYSIVFKISLEIRRGSWKIGRNMKFLVWKQESSGKKPKTTITAGWAQS